MKSRKQSESNQCLKARYLNTLPIDDGFFDVKPEGYIVNGLINSLLSRNFGHYLQFSIFHLFPLEHFTC